MNYGIGAKMRYEKRMIIMVPGITPHEAKGLVGAKVAWPIDKPTIYGKINKIYGTRNGYLLATFKKGLPGDSIDKSIKIIKK
jgi:ribosomal protein L35AE/L33A